MASQEEEVVIDLRKMKMAELKKELQHRNLKTSGNKQDLIERLQQYLEEHEGAEVADEEILKEEEGEIDDNILIDDKKLEDGSEDSVSSEQEQKIKQTNKERIQETKTEEGEEKTAPPSPVGLTDRQKLEFRAQKFGITVKDMNMDARKAARSERFGTGAAGSMSSGKIDSDPNKLQKRAERFGGIVSDTLSKSDAEERKRKRLARFGRGLSGGLSESNDVSTEKKKKRAERFGLSVA